MEGCSATKTNIRGAKTQVKSARITRKRMNVGQNHEKTSKIHD